MDTKQDDKPFIVMCPHCECYIEILSIACGIFRHAVYKNSGQYINPHMPENECKRLIEDGMIHGCGKPFRLIDKKTPPEKCEYI